MCVCVHSRFIENPLIESWETNPCFFRGGGVCHMNVTLDKVSIGYVFVGIVTESETCCIYEAVLLIIKVAACNLLEASNFIA
jgi:hypothetical protein